MDCDNSCSYNGVCRDYVCYCTPSFTDYDCSEYVDEDKQEGMKITSAKYYLVAGVVFGLILGFLIVRCLVFKNLEKEYMKFKEWMKYIYTIFNCY